MILTIEFERDSILPINKIPKICTVIDPYSLPLPYKVSYKIQRYGLALCSRAFEVDDPPLTRMTYLLVIVGNAQSL